MKTISGTAGTVTTSADVPQNLIDLVDATQIENVVQTLLDNDATLAASSSATIRHATSIADMQALSGAAGVVCLTYISNVPTLYVWSSVNSTNLTGYTATSGGYWVPAVDAIAGTQLATLVAGTGRVNQRPTTHWLYNYLTGSLPYTSATAVFPSTTQIGPSLTVSGVESGHILEISVDLEIRASSAGKGYFFVQIFEPTGSTYIYSRPMDLELSSTLSRHFSCTFPWTSSSATSGKVVKFLASVDTSSVIIDSGDYIIKHIIP